MVVDVYKNCPSFENEYYILRMVDKADKLDLLKVYSDEKAVSFLIVIIVAEITFTIQLKTEWHRRLNIGFGNMIDKGLSVGRLFQKQQKKQSAR